MIDVPVSAAFNRHAALVSSPQPHPTRSSRAVGSRTQLRDTPRPFLRDERKRIHAVSSSRPDGPISTQITNVGRPLLGVAPLLQVKIRGRRFVGLPLSPVLFPAEPERTKCMA